MNGGSFLPVRLNVTMPAAERNSAVVRLVNVSVPCWNGSPQPRGGFPAPSDAGFVARQNVPSILAHAIPQCVYSWYGLLRAPAIADRPVVTPEPDVVIDADPQPAPAFARATNTRAPILIRPHYAGGREPSHERGFVSRPACRLLIDTTAGMDSSHRTFPRKRPAVLQLDDPCGVVSSRIADRHCLGRRPYA